MLFAFSEMFGSSCLRPPEAVSQPRKPKFPKIQDPFNLQDARKHNIPKYSKNAQQNLVFDTFWPERQPVKTVLEPFGRSAGKFQVERRA